MISLKSTATESNGLLGDFCLHQLHFNKHHLIMSPQLCVCVGVWVCVCVVCVVCVCGVCVCVCGVCVCVVWGVRFVPAPMYHQ